MAEAEEQEGSAIAGHTLALLRRMDRRQDNLLDLMTRQQDLISRLERDMREGFDVISRRFDPADRDLREIKSDIMLLENKLLNRMSAELELSRRPERIEGRLAVEADERLSPSTF